jgi:TolB protein
MLMNQPTALRRNRAKSHWAAALAGSCVLLLTASAQAAAEVDHPLAYLAVDDGYWQVWVAELDGSHAQLVTRSPYDKIKISWFADGDRLLVSGAAGEIVVVSIDSGQETPVPLPIGQGSDATVSPDGTQIAFSAVNAGSADTNDIWVVAADGSAARKITTLAALQHEPVWSRDGAALYFLSGSGGQSHDIYRVALDGQSLEQLTAGQLYHFDVAVAADGTLAFSSNRSGNYDLWIRDRDGREHVLIATPDLESEPTWDSSDRKLVFTRIADGVANLWSISREGGTPAPVTRHPQGARRAAIWRPAPIGKVSP